MGIRPAGCGLGPPAARGPDRTATDSRLLLLVARRPARGLHASLRRAGDPAPQDPHLVRRAAGDRTGHLIPRAGTLARQPASLAGRESHRLTSVFAASRSTGPSAVPA